MPDTANNLIRNLRTRYRPDLSQSETAKLLGVNRTNLNKLERGGIRRPPPDLLERMIELYGCDPAVAGLLRIVCGERWEGELHEDAGIGEDLKDDVMLLVQQAASVQAIVCDPTWLLKVGKPGWSLAVPEVTVLGGYAWRAGQGGEREWLAELRNGFVGPERAAYLVPFDKLMYSWPTSDRFLVDGVLVVVNAQSVFRVTADAGEIRYEDSVFAQRKAAAYSPKEAERAFNRCEAAARTLFRLDV
jgi:transcriptional regulator with XRE-family HTH domain